MKRMIEMGGVFEFVARDKDGNVKWTATARNKVPNAALDQALDAWLCGGTQATAFYIGLKGTGTPAAGDTLASHATWSEIADYVGSRKAWTNGAVSGQAVSNSGSAALFEANASITVYGAFLCDAETGTSGLLVSVADFDGGVSKSLDSGEKLEVTYTMQAASST